MPEIKKPKVQAKLMLPTGSQDTLRRAAAHYGKSMSAVVEELIDEVLAPEMKDAAQ